MDVGRQAGRQAAGRQQAGSISPCTGRAALRRKNG